MAREPDLFICRGAFEQERVAWLNKVFKEASDRGVADIHFQEQEGALRVRFRIRGRLEDYERVHGELPKTVDEKIRSRCQMPPGDRHTPLDGRMRLRFPSGTIDVRVAVVPNLSGQLTVCRLLDQANSSRRLDEIHMTDMLRVALQELIDEPQGLFLVTGPTGSGKTTMLYAILNEVNTPDRNIITIENPVEYQVPGISQINVDHHTTFAKALRAVLRQDPDVILVGEIRDAETASIAVQAAITGHLVLATLHANNAALAVTRMVELGVDQTTLAAALRGVTAQRLAPRLSTESPLTTPGEADHAWLALHGIVGRDMLFPAEDGCEFKGVAPVIEMISVDNRVRRCIPDGAQAIYEAAASQSQFETLAAAGVRMASEGVTTLGAIKLIVGSNDPVLVQTRRLGQSLVESGAITLPQLYTALSRQARLRTEGRLKTLGAILLEDNAIGHHDLIAAIGVSPAAVPVASALVNRGLVSSEDFDRAVASWRLRSGDSIFDILVEKGLCTNEQIYDTANIPV